MESPNDKSENGAGGGQHSLHPLMIDLVLENVFRYCDPQHMSSYRGVNKKWHTISEPFWLSTVPTILLFNRSPADVTSPKSHFFSKKAAPLSQFIRLVKPRGREPADYDGYKSLGRHTKFGIYFDKLESELERGRFSTFKSAWASTLTHLHFGNKGLTELSLFLDLLACKFTPKLEVLQLQVRLGWKEIVATKLEPLSFDNVVPSLEQVNANLKSLALQVTVEEPDSKSWMYLPVNWLKQLFCYPNLEHLAINYENDQFVQSLEGIFNDIMRIRQFGEKTNRKLMDLKTVDISYQFNTFTGGAMFPGSYVFLDKTLSLEKFTFSHGIRTKEPLVQHFLSMQPNLSHLTVRSESPGWPMSFLGGISHLSSLTLTGLPQEDVSWLQTCQSLHSLKLRRDEADKDGTFQSSGQRMMMWTMMMAPGNLLLPALTTFHCEYWWEWEQVLPQVTTRLKEWFPNLKRLRLHVANNTLPLICKLWPRLEELEGIGGNLDDGGVCGEDQIEAFVAKQFLGKKAPKRKLSAPPIAQFKELRVFTTESFFNELVEPDLTDASAYCGFLNCPKLERIQVAMTSTGKKEFEDKILKDLKQKIPNVQIRFVYCKKAVTRAIMMGK